MHEVIGAHLRAGVARLKASPTFRALRRELEAVRVYMRRVSGKATPRIVGLRPGENILLRTHARTEVFRIADAPDRQRVTVRGYIDSVTVTPPSSRTHTHSLLAILSDGSGVVELQWPGRDSIPGLSCGLMVEVEGVLGYQGGRRAMVHPRYRFIDAELEQ